VNILAAIHCTVILLFLIPLIHHWYQHFVCLWHKLTNSKITINFTILIESDLGTQAAHLYHLCIIIHKPGCINLWQPTWNTVHTALVSCCPSTAGVQQASICNNWCDSDCSISLPSSGRKKSRMRQSPRLIVVTVGKYSGPSVCGCLYMHTTSQQPTKHF